MSFIRRKIDVQIALNGDTFDGSNNIITLSGLRVNAVIHTFIGGTGGWASDATLRISGMKNADMAKLSTLGFIANNYNGASGQMNSINVFAGDDQAGMTLAFSGAITSGNVNYNAQPDVGVDLVCNALTGLQFQSIAASSYKGSMSVATMLQAICNAAGMSFVNNGVTAMLSNHAVGGSPLKQIKDICLAAGIFYKIENGPQAMTLTVWPSGSNADDTIIDVGPETGMVGYPQYSVRGINISCLYNPSIAVGRQINVTSSTPAPAANAPLQVPGTLPGQGPLQISGANGTFSVIGVTHELASEIPNGPWFTHSELSSLPYNAR
ncbi:baseplate hub protein [Rhodanobacter hydrolyticus]|uniref:Uncharacterized protein n=1 Tax=Rhodanobacter hydrolyticus TaxID=2250595 RepID=A0ABW8J6Y6_9GAMM